MAGVVHNETGAEGEFEVQLELDETAVPAEGDPGILPVNLPAKSDPLILKRKIRLEAGATGKVRFPVRFESEGEATWTWRVRGKENGDAVVSTFNVRSPMPELTEMKFARLTGPKDAAKILGGLDPELLQGRGELEITLSTSRMLEGAAALDYVLKYPYGCVEQTTSSLMPWLKLQSLQKAAPILGRPPAEIRSALQSGADRLLSMQTEEGGLGYWPGADRPVFWGSAYGGFALVLAEESGARVSETRLENLLEYLQQELKDPPFKKRPEKLVEQSLALYTLARAGTPNKAYQNVFFENRQHLPREARALLALAIAESGGNPGDARKLIEENPSDDMVNYRWWLARSYLTALHALAWERIDPNHPKSLKALEELFASRNRLGHWDTTWHNAWAILTLSEFAEHEADPSQKDREIPVRWGNAAQSIALTAGPSSGAVRFTFEDMDGAVPEIMLPRGEELYMHARLRARPPVVPQDPRSNGFRLKRNYERLLPTGLTEPAEDLRIGDLVLVTLDFEAETPGRYLVLDDPLPAGLEAVNPELQVIRRRTSPQGGLPAVADRSP